MFVARVGRVFFANYTCKNGQRPKFCTSFVLFTAEKNPSSRERSKKNAKILDIPLFNPIKRGTFWTFYHLRGQICPKAFS